MAAIALHDVDENLHMTDLCPVCGDPAFSARYHPNVARQVARQNNPPVTLYAVTIYPFEDMTPDQLYFTRRFDAETFARDLMRLPARLANRLAGGEAPVLVREIVTVSLYEAQDRLEKWIESESLPIRVAR
jgi:hypothetical protein